MEAELKASREAETKTGESLKVANLEVQKMKEDAAGQAQLLTSAQAEIKQLKEDYQALDDASLVTKLKSHQNCLRQVKVILASAGLEVDLSEVGFLKKVKDGKIVGSPDPEGIEEIEDSSSSEEETGGEEEEQATQQDPPPEN